MAVRGTQESAPTHTKLYRPYFAPAEVERLSAKQRGKLSVSREERARQQACSFIDATGVRCGFPRRTIATAQQLYMRFHLFFPYKDFNYIEVSLAALYVSSKLLDTLKKPRDIILASYPIRFPQLVRKGTIDPSVAQAHGLDSERLRVLSIERLVLETLAFHFGAQDGLKVVIKIGKKLGLSKSLCGDAWRVAIDCHRTQAPLSYPPHIIALGSIYAASLLLSESDLPSEPSSTANEKSILWVVDLLGNEGGWEKDYITSVGQVDDVTHALLDLYHSIRSNPENQPLLTPSPVSPHDHPPSAAPQNPSSLYSSLTAFPLPSYWTPQTLTELKIRLREKRGSVATVPPMWDGREDGETVQISDGMGRNDATLRFLWDEETISGGDVGP
ncbi:hypothetical protein L202_05379 [Cryptococcus amylolentus CBS 6039]|uniref:Uncharacterized protein n=2 Tax=Cryptococcus amylolentus TaxID=104669 RepID=A0A1E3HKB5_9TREE|nr:hypothetical protein L202_05379 [Cryptococcus amylolentus CBS 6039]ODN76769.1 hypothetical protein L202_05379 [Cryptococcus amylolentus CBS 6039]ODO04700.1 hypothetical protein I350_05309 [Cryptococcus amylolentus CBS 6273]